MAPHTRSSPVPVALTSRSSSLNTDRGDVGFLTYDDCDVLIKQLQAACEVELFSQAEIAEVVRWCAGTLWRERLTGPC